MSRSSLNQFQESLITTKTPLVFIPPYPKTDILSAAFALVEFFALRGIATKLICETAERLPERLEFIKEPPEVLPLLTGARDFVVVFKTKYNPISEVRTEQVDDEMHIYITPEKASIDPRDFSFLPSTFSYDTVFVLGALDKEHLGVPYEKNPDVFYEVPVVNIDNKSANERFGTTNVVDPTASSVCEILYEAFGSIKKTPAPSLELLEYLLSGITTATQSFQRKNTSPKALQFASELMAQGADQQKIVNALFKTQPLHLLKLWGKIMANIKWNEKLSLIWSLVDISDIVQSRASLLDLPIVLDKVALSYPSAKLTMLIYQEHKDETRILLTSPVADILETLEQLLPESKREGDVLNYPLSTSSLEAAEEFILDKLDGLK